MLLMVCLRRTSQTMRARKLLASCGHTHGQMQVCTGKPISSEQEVQITVMLNEGRDPEGRPPFTARK